MLDSPSITGANLYELELVGDVHPRVAGAAITRRSASFRVAAPWPEAAETAGRQLFVGEASRRGLEVGPGVPICRCSPLGEPPGDNT